MAAFQDNTYILDAVIVLFCEGCMEKSLFGLIREKAAEQYMNEMNDEFHYFAIWEPSTPLQIGDIGELNDNKFTYLTNLRNKGIDFTVRMDSAKGELSHHSSGAISISPKVTGDVGIPKYLDLVDGDIIVKFGRRNAILFEASGVEHQMIEEVDKIDNMIEKESEIGNWKKNWVVITDLLIADSATVLISNEKDAFVVLKAKAEVPNLPLANLSASFEAAYKQNMQTAITCQSGLTPLFQLRGVIKPLFGKPKYGGIRTKGMTIDNLPQSISSKRTEIMVGDIEFEPFK